ncbi:STAS domain-containing protein [Streptomyces sp. NPDC056165]|uniref:STAS domain-containing protein n=1 Tax=Streptomyces sp. NPDC056165 TaxID=3345733 RepID=UPI0035D8303C
MHPEFHISHHDESNWTVVEIGGDVDVATVPHIREYVAHRIMAEGRHRLIIDLTRVRFIDSTGLGTLVAIRKWIQARAGDLRLVLTNPDVLRIFRITSLRRVFPIHESVETALSDMT